MQQTTDHVLAEIAREPSRNGSLNTFCTSLETQITEALHGCSIPSQAQKRIDAVFQNCEANIAKYDAALNMNAPPPATWQELAEVLAGPTVTHGQDQQKQGRG
jgi:hypothetical protein